MDIPIYCFLKDIQLYYLDSVLWARWCVLPTVYTFLNGVALVQHSEATLTPRVICMFECVCVYSSEYMWDYPGLLHNIFEGVSASTGDVADHIALPCGFTPLIYCLYSPSWPSGPFGGEFSIWPNMRSSWLVWWRRTGAFVLSAWPWHRGRCWTPRPYRGGGSACGLHCVSPPPEGGNDWGSVVWYVGSRLGPHSAGSNSNWRTKKEGLPSWVAS